jgi:hypothetical protein
MHVYVGTSGTTIPNGEAASTPRNSHGPRCSRKYAERWTVEINYTFSAPLKVGRVGSRMPRRLFVHVEGATAVTHILKLQHWRTAPFVL